jgi:TPR repeat protein
MLRSFFLLAVAAVIGALLVSTGCDGYDSDAPAPTEAKPVSAPIEVVTQPAPAAPELQQQAAALDPGACATTEACDAEASALDRAGHPDRAAPLYARACDLGLGTACHRLGELHRDGKGVPADDDQARALFTRGCQQGSNAACDALGH